VVIGNVYRKFCEVWTCGFWYIRAEDGQTSWSQYLAPLPDGSVVFVRWRQCALPSNTWFPRPTRLSNSNRILMCTAVFAQLTADSPYILQWAAPFFLRNCPLAREIWTPSNTRYPESTSQTTSRSVQRFLHSWRLWQTERQTARQTDRPTDRPTDHATPSVIIGRIYVVLRCGLMIMLCCRGDAVLAGDGEEDAVRFTQRDINTGQVLYKYQMSASDQSSTSWLTLDSSDEHWPHQRDSFQLTVTTASADPLSHRSVSLTTLSSTDRFCPVSKPGQGNDLNWFQLSYRRGTARRLKSVEILSAAAQLYEKSHLTRRIVLSCGIKNITSWFFGLVTKHLARVWQTDRRTDGQRDRITTPKTALA